MKPERLDKAVVATAIVQALQLWANNRYQIPMRRHWELDDDWFSWFLKTWRVARTIREGRQRTAAKIIHQGLRSPLSGKAVVAAVDKLALQLKEQKVSVKGRAKPATIPFRYLSYQRWRGFVDLAGFAPMIQLLVRA